MHCLQTAAQLSSLVFILLSQSVEVQAGIVPLRRHEGSHSNLSGSALAPGSAGSAPGSAITTSGRSQSIRSRSSTFATSPLARASNASIVPAGSPISANVPSVSGKVIGVVQAIPNHAHSPPLTTMPPIDPAKLSAIAAELASLGFGRLPNIANATMTASATASKAQLQIANSASATASRGVVSRAIVPLFSGLRPVSNVTLPSSTHKKVLSVIPPSSRTGPASQSPRSAAAAASALAQQQGAGDQDGHVTVTKTTTVIIAPSGVFVPSGLLLLLPTPSRIAPGVSPGDGNAAGDKPGPHCRSHSKSNMSASSRTASAAIAGASGNDTLATSASAKASASSSSKSFASASSPLLIVPNVATASAARSTITVQASQKPSVIVIIPFDPDAPASATPSSR